MASDPPYVFDEEATRRYIAATENDPLVNFVHKYTVLQTLGDVTGKSILDLGSGTGLFCRAIKALGASEVVGVDISHSMLKYASGLESENPLGIQYREGDGKSLGKIGEFDWVMANFVLIFMNSVENLQDFVQVIYDNLKPTGKFIGVQFNCFSENWYNKVAKYKREAVKVEEFTNYKKVKFTCTASENQGVIQYYFDMATYQNVFKKVGFRSFTVNALLLDPEADKEMPKSYFQDYLESQCSVILFAEK